MIEIEECYTLAVDS